MLLSVEAVDLFSDEIKKADAVLLQQEVPASVNLLAIELARTYQRRIILIRRLPQPTQMNWLAFQDWFLYPMNWKLNLRCRNDSPVW